MTNVNTPADVAVPGTPGPLQPTTCAWLAALLGWTILLCFYCPQGGSEFEVTDAWVAQTAREMQQRGSWRALVVPTFCGQTRIQKSPGPYWAVLVASALRGGEVDKASVRMPNAVAAVVLVLTVFWLARRIAGERAAVFAGFASASSLMVLYWSHRGASDLGVTTLMALSLACLWVGTECEPPGRRRIILWLAGYLFSGLAMLYKMPMPLVCVGLPALLYLLLRRRWDVLRSRWHLLGLALFLLPWLPWVVAVLLIEPTAWGKWQIEFWGRLTGASANAMGHSWESYLLYVGVVFVFCIPYSLSIPAALWRAARGVPDVRRDGLVFLLAWFASLFIFFTLAADKSNRYILPAMPPLFVLLGVELAAFFDPGRRAAPARDRLGTLAVCLLVPGALVAGLIVFYREWYEERLAGAVAWREIWPPLVVAMVIFAAGAIAAALLYARRREHVSFATLVGTMWLVWLWCWPTVLPKVGSQLPLRDFARQLAALTPEQQAAIRQIGQQDPRIIWYSGVCFPRLLDDLELVRRLGAEYPPERGLLAIAEEMNRRLRQDGLALFVVSARTYRLLRELQSLDSLDENLRMPQTYPWIQARVGKVKRRFILFGNRPPPWRPPQLVLPERLDHLGRRILRSLRTREESPHPDTQPTATRPGSDG